MNLELTIWWCDEHRAEGITPGHDAVGKPLHDENVGYCWYAYYLGETAVNTAQCRIMKKLLIDIPPENR